MRRAPSLLAVLCTFTDASEWVPAPPLPFPVIGNQGGISDGKLLVVGGFTPAAGNMIAALKLLRLLRVLKLVKSLPQLAVLVNALLMGFSSIGFIACTTG